MGRRFRDFDWSGTPIGAPECWPLTWRNAARLILNSSHALALGLGKDLIYLYNDAFIALGGPTRHPSALGQPVRVVWQEIWSDILLPRFTKTLATGEPTDEENLFLPLSRSGYLEETYISFSFAALPDDQDRPSGIFCTATENTGRVIAQRQIECLRRLAAQSASADSPESVCATAAATLEDQAADVPFGLVYLVDAEGAQATLVRDFGLERLPPSAALSAHLGSAPDPFCLATAAARKEPVLIEGIEALIGSSLRRKSLVPRRALAIPLASAASRELSGILVVGLNRMRPEAESREFVMLVAKQLESAISNARARHDAEERARKLAEIDRAKTVFFSNISHEFRTPVTLLLGPIDQILSETAIGAKERELLERARRGANRLLKLVNSLLEFSRLEAGRIEASYEPVNLAALTADLASEFRSAFEQADVQLWVECLPLPEAVFVDPDMWEKIVLNLLSNALKFTLSGAVTVRLHARDESACLQVIDTGCGIAAADLPHLFERFYRGQSEQARSVEGTGIGLSLVQELVRLHGGTVQATSTLGEGTTIKVSVPLGSGHLPPERVGAARRLTSSRTGAQPFVDEAFGWVSPSSASAAMDERAPSTDFTGPHARQPKRQDRVLVVDDNSDMRGYLCSVLEHGYGVDAVPDGMAALTRICEQHYDLMIVDIMMPSMTGLELLQAVRSDPRIAHTPVILLSARAGEEASAEGLYAGADDYLPKPFSRQDLLARVENRLTQAKLRAAERLARRRAEAAVRARDKLYSVLAHDLRSPLQTAYMCLTRLQQQELKAGQRKAAATLERSLERLHRQLEAVLEQVQAISTDGPRPA
jgi:signal transduction histidine kinase